MTTIYLAIKNRDDVAIRVDDLPPRSLANPSYIEESEYDDAVSIARPPAGIWGSPFEFTLSKPFAAAAKRLAKRHGLKLITDTMYVR